MHTGCKSRGGGGCFNFCQKGSRLSGKIASGGGPPILSFIAFLLRSVLKFTCGGPK